MTGSGVPEISHVPPESSCDEELVAEITDLVNEVYDTAEEGLWTPGTARTSAEEMVSVVRSGEMVVARVRERVVGCVRVRHLDEETTEFGMLAVSPRHRGEGMGRDLVRYAERFALRSGRDVMQLELLVPRTWSHPSKDFLAAWYGRIGYRVVRRGTIDESYPALAPMLATACDFVVHHKDLEADGQPSQPEASPGSPPPGVRSRAGRRVRRMLGR